MRLLVQRVTDAAVRIENHVVGSIGKGLLVLVGIGTDDTPDTVERSAQKLLDLRIFSDEAGKMNLSVQQIRGELLVVSQFTLWADTRKGNRPSFTQAASPVQAIPLYERFIVRLGESGLNVQTGQFGAHMQVSLTNDGPVTIWLEVL
jgi:D-tyrosyl-tRNA(Tyr) deacylase